MMSSMSDFALPLALEIAARSISSRELGNSNSQFRAFPRFQMSNALPCAPLSEHGKFVR